jgi:hypothetical protein
MVRGECVPMQNTGSPVALAALALLGIIGGALYGNYDKINYFFSFLFRTLPGILYCSFFTLNSFLATLSVFFEYSHLTHGNGVNFIKYYQKIKYLIIQYLLGMLRIY